MPLNTITVLAKSPYGRTLFYPADPKAAAFAKLTGKTTLDKSDIAIIKEQLGFDVTVTHPETGV